MRVSVRTVNQWMKDGKLESVRLFDHPRFRKSSLDACLKEKERKEE